MRNILYRFYTMRATLFHDANVVHCESLPLKFGTPFFTLQSAADISGGRVHSFVICLHQIVEVQTEMLAREVEPPHLLRLGSRRLFSRMQAADVGINSHMPLGQLSYAGAVNSDRTPLFAYEEITNVLGLRFAAQDERNMLGLIIPQLELQHDIDQFSQQPIMAHDDYPDRNCRRNLQNALNALSQLATVKTGFDAEPMQLAQIFADPRAVDLLVRDVRRLH